MKTRVIKYWANTAWLFGVQVHVQAQEDEQLYRWEGRGIAKDGFRKKDTWYWDTKHDKLDYSTAASIAEAISTYNTYDAVIVVSEHGH